MGGSFIEGQNLRSDGFSACSIGRHDFDYSAISSSSSAIYKYIYTLPYIVSGTC